MRYPEADWVPWKPADEQGRPAFYPGRNRPIAVVLHVMAGHASTARRWAVEGHFGASWHYTVARDGHVMQHLDHTDGGYHAGISSQQAAGHPPAWTLWRGSGENINHYTIGIEHEGFPGEPFPAAQASASRELCHWLAAVLDVPFARERFPSHADIDSVNRANDFNTLLLREQFYAFLFEGDPMTEDDIRRIVREELSQLATNLIDTRLRQVMASRETLRALASHPDAGVVERAVSLLREHPSLREER